MNSRIASDLNGGDAYPSSINATLRPVGVYVGAVENVRSNVWTET
jgi:hypothetical protein